MDCFAYAQQGKCTAFVTWNRSSVVEMRRLVDYRLKRTGVGQQPIGRTDGERMLAQKSFGIGFDAAMASANLADPSAERKGGNEKDDGCKTRR